MTEYKKATKGKAKVIETEDGETVRISSSKNSRHRGVTVLLGDEVFREQVNGFSAFLKEYAVVGLAVGFVIGLQAQTLVKQFLASFLTPLIDLVLHDVSGRYFAVGSGANMVKFAWGQFLYSFIGFLFVLFVIYLIVKIFKLDKFADKKKK